MHATRPTDEYIMLLSHGAVIIDNDEEDSKQREFGWKIENSPLDLFI